MNKKIKKFDFKQAYNGIQEVKQKIKGLSFEDACELLCCYYVDDEVGDFYDWNFEGTIYNDNGKATTSDDCLYSVIPDDWEQGDESIDLTEQEIYERSIKQ